MPSSCPWEKLFSSLRLFLFIGALSLCLPPPAAGALWFATPEGGGDGKSWERPATLSHALATASSGDEIWAAEGVYFPEFDERGNPTQRAERTFLLKEGLKLYGGFPLGGSPPFQDRNPAAFPSILSGLPSEGGVASRAFRVVTIKNEGEITLIDGFEISGGRADGAGESGFGGGVYCKNSRLALQDSILTDNQAKSGGGLYADGSHIQLKGCRLTENEALSGGGVYTVASEGIFQDCLFQGNGALKGASGLMGGAGVRDSGGSTLTFECCSFIENLLFTPSGSAYGGGLYIANGTGASVVNCTFWGNSVSPESNGMGYGGAIYLAGKTSSLQLVNCTLWGNSAKDSGGGLYVSRSSAAVVNSIFYENGGKGIEGSADGIVKLYSSIVPLKSPVLTVIEEDVLNCDPLLAPPAFNGGFTPTLALKKGSPAVDGGAGPGIVSFGGEDFIVPARDQRGKPRSDGKVDLGAVEYQSYSLTITTAGDGEGSVRVSPEMEAYDEGAEVRLLAVPATGSQFSGWRGDGAGSDESLRVVMDDSKVVVASFTMAQTFEERGRGSSTRTEGGCHSFNPTGFMVFLFIPAALLFRK